MLTYRNKLRALAAVALVAALAAGIVGGRVARVWHPGEHFWLVYPVLLLLSGLALIATLPWWRRLDDMQRSSHLVSWYWGGLAGGFATIMGVVAATGPRSDFSLGGFYMMLGQAAAYFLCLGIWRLRYRGSEA